MTLPRTHMTLTSGNLALLDPKNPEDDPVVPLVVVSGRPVDLPHGVVYVLREDLPLVEELITTKSWWDTVDILAIHVVGPILKAHPKEIRKWNKRWMTSDNLWLNRTAILFQLTWKEETDKELLFANIERHADHKDFFIRKAIGWSLRTLAETDPAAVKAFVRSHTLAPLSEREALRKIE